MIRPLHPLALAAAAALAGCANSPTPHYDARFGQAVRQAKQQQILNPTPSTEVATGIDGPAAKETMIRYHESFKTPPRTATVINIGGPIGSGGGGGGR